MARRLYRPRPATVAASADGVPERVGRGEVDSVREEWLVEDRWWTARPLRRRYFELTHGERRERGRVLRPRERSLVLAEGRADCTPSCTRTRRTRSWTARPRRRRSPPRPPCTATRPSRSPTTTGCTGRWSSRTRARGSGVKAITGTEVTLDDGSHLTLLAADRTGYSNLCRLLTAAHAHTRANPRERTPPHATLEQVEQHADGLSCACPAARATARPSVMGARLLAAFGRERFRVELQRPFWRRDRTRNRMLAQLAERLRRAVRGDGQRALPPSRPRPAPGRLRGGAAAVGARPDRAPAPRQRHIGDGLPRRHGGALRRPSRGGRGDGADRGADRVRPHARPRLPLSRRGGSRGRPQAGRAVRRAAARALSAQRRARRGGRRASRRSCA